MRDLVITQNITVDGVVEMVGDWFDPANRAGADLADLTEALREQREAADALLVGRQTFTDLRGYWPAQTDDPTGTSDYLNRVAKYVVSSTVDDPQWSNSTVLAGLDGVRELKSAPGADIVCTGSIELSHALIAAGLVDEYRLFTYPVLSGRGRRLFTEATGPLRLTQSRALRSGVVLSVYRPA